MGSLWTRIAATIGDAFTRYPPSLYSVIHANRDVLYNRISLEFLCFMVTSECEASSNGLSLRLHRPPVLKGASNQSRTRVALPSVSTS